MKHQEQEQQVVAPEGGSLQASAHQQALDLLYAGRLTQREYETFRDTVFEEKLASWNRGYEAAEEWHKGWQQHSE